MYTINKITSYSVVDYAAQELKKYLRMMMPEGGDIKIAYNPDAKDGFRLGLMQDFGLDVSDAEDTVLDDIIYMDCDENGGIIAGDNPRSVLLSVYEYLRRNGCRWFLPGVDGEYIPMQDIKPVKYRHKPSCRYRGWCSEGAQFQQNILEAIELMPKLGMNVFMIQFVNPSVFYNRYYNHTVNKENRIAEPIFPTQSLQWKRQCEVELARRGLQLHDIGHGFNYLPFGINIMTGKTIEEKEASLTAEQRSILAEIGGERKLFKGSAANTNFCMSNAEARAKVADFIVDFSSNHGNIDYLHVWLADGSNNHCECAECQKKTPSDWYVMLLNEIDEKLAKAGLDTRIVFISYVDTTWAPTCESIKNPDRFILLFAPIFRCYAYSIPGGRGESTAVPYNRNKNVFPDSLGASLDYLDEWKKVWKGPNVAFEYHFWRHQCYDLSGLMQARLLNEEVKLYKENDVNGIIQCGTQRTFFPTGISFYSYARTLFDTSLTYEEIEEDYFSCCFGENWKYYRDYLAKLFDALPFEFFSRDVARTRKNVHYDPERADKIEAIHGLTKGLREHLKENCNPDMRIKSISAKLLWYHADFCDLVAGWMSAKARGEIELAADLAEKARIECGKFEAEVQNYFDHNLYFGEYAHTQKQVSPSKEDIVSID